MKETICAIILTKNEEIHLERILKQLSKLMNNILIVDSGSTDQTFEIAKKYRCDFIFNKFAAWDFLLLLFFRFFL